MKTGRTIESLAREVLAQKDEARDFVTPSDQTTVNYHWRDDDNGGPIKAGDFSIDIPGKARFGINRLAHEQLAAFGDIPQKYYDRMAARQPNLAATNVNAWLREQKTPRLARMLRGKMRAWLSPGYRPLDNVKLLEAVMPAIAGVGGTVFSSEITERRLYVQIRSPKLEGEVKVGDVVQGGLAIRNSEVGCGSLSIEFLLYRLVCKNGAIMEKVIRKSHVGRKIKLGDGGDEGEAFEHFSDETRTLEDAAFFSKVRDMVATTMTEERFRGVLASAQRAAGLVVTTAPEKMVETLAREVRMTKDEGGKMLRHLIEGGDLSAWGFANSVTHVAHDVESYDRAVELETAGGNLLNLSAAQWKRLADKAATPDEN